MEESLESVVQAPASAVISVFKPLFLIITIIYGIMTWYNHWMAALTVLTGAVFCCMQFFCKKGRYEYRLSREGFLVERVSQGGGRRCLLSCRAEELELLAKSRSESLRKYMAGGRRIFMRDLASGKHLNREYVVVCRQGERRRFFLVELEEPMIEGFQRLLPGRVYLT